MDWHRWHRCLHRPVSATGEHVHALRTGDDSTSRSITESHSPSSTSSVEYVIVVCRKWIAVRASMLRTFSWYNCRAVFRASRCSWRPSPCPDRSDGHRSSSVCSMMLIDGPVIVSGVNGTLVLHPILSIDCNDACVRTEFGVITQAPAIRVRQGSPSALCALIASRSAY